MLKRLATLCKHLYAHRHIRLVIATFFSVGKVLSSAGGTLFGVKETLHTYGIDSPGTIALSGSLTALNAVLTTANRAPPLYRKLLKGLPTVPIVPPPAEHYRRLDGSSVAVHIEPPRAISVIALANAVPALSVAALSRGSKGLYYVISSLCHLSLPFSALNAYLSAITLIDEIYPDANSQLRLSFAYFVTISSMMSYCTFNLARMRRNVLKFCAGVDYRYTQGTYDLGAKTLLATLFSTIFGIIAGVGTAYLGTSRSLDLFPATQGFSPDEKESLVIASVVASLFSSTFIFAFSCYDQIKAHLEPHLREPDHFPFPLYAKGLTLIDSTSNSMTGFIGVINLIDRLLNHNLNRVALILIGIAPLANNIFMNYSLGLIGMQPTLKWLQAHCCYAEDRGPAIDSRRVSIDVRVPQAVLAEPELSPILANALPPSPPSLLTPPEQPWRAFSPQAKQSAFFWHSREPLSGRSNNEPGSRDALIIAAGEAEPVSASP